MEIADQDEAFWKNFTNTINKLKGGTYVGHPLYTNFVATHSNDPVGVIRSALIALQNAVEQIRSEQECDVSQLAYQMIITMLFYIDMWGRTVKVTMGELDGRDPIDVEGDQVERLYRLISEKGHDYNSGGISILTYFIWGEKSIIHEMHKRAQRLLSISYAAGGKTNFEEAPSTAFDLCAYGLFLLSYLNIFNPEPSI